MDNQNKNNQQNEIKKSALTGSYIISGEGDKKNKSNEYKNRNTFSGSFVEAPGSDILKILGKLFKK